MYRIFALVYLLFVSFFSAAQERIKYTSWLVGNAADVSTDATGGVLLMGGGTDNDHAMRWMIQKADTGDIVVIRATGSDGYNAYLYALAPCNSVETILIDSRSLANNADIVQKIRNAEALFIAGGDQYDYVSFWKDTPVEEAINYLINTKKVVVGGTSAGCAIQGKVYFDAFSGTIRSDEALSNPYSPLLSLQRDDFVSHSILANTITDTHYDDPDRRGRHTAFLSRMMKDWLIIPKGIGIDEKTAVCIEPNGIGKVFGNSSFDYAYFLQATGEVPEICLQDKPLTWDRGGQAVKVYKVSGNAEGSHTFNFNTWSEGTGGTWLYFYACNGIFLNSCTITGINEEHSASMQVFPNPATNGSMSLIAPMRIGQIFQAVLYNMLGEVVHSSVQVYAPSMKLQWQKASSGQYVLLVQAQEEAWRVKMTLE